MLTEIPPLYRKRAPRSRRETDALPSNANLMKVLLLASGALLLEFDGPVIVDSSSPPTTWSFHGITSIQTGAVNFGQSVYLIVDGVINSGDPVVFAGGDPGARTPEGGYVNAVSTVVSDW